MISGKIYKSTGSWYLVKTPEGETWNARLRGTFKLDGITSTNPVAVGDDVLFEPEHEEEKTAIITEICDRKNYINRQSPSHRFQHHIVAANIDQSLLIVTLKEPRTSQGFIDRWLVACEAYHVPATLLFNKSDLFRKKEDEKFEAWKGMYEKIGYTVIRMSMETGEGIEDVRICLHGKISLLSGHSGVGKSSFLNAILPSLDLKTKDVSGWSGKGMHTTTFAEMFDIPDMRSQEVRSSQPASSPTRIIDTPGMREFGIVDITRQELSGYFPEMRALAGECQFNNCLHKEEPGCSVKHAVAAGQIAEDRYISYLTILDSIASKSY